MIALFCLLDCGHCKNWQAADNMTASNLTEIWDYIDTNFDKTKTKEVVADLTSDTYLVNFATGMSTYLNGKWGTAWNVVVVYITDIVNADTVVYGYAFRNHWMWYNGYTMQDGFFVSFIIWKDYNCDHYYEFNSNIPPALNYDLDSAAELNTFTSEQIATWTYEEPWLAAFSYVDTLQKKSGFEGKAFSMIMSQSNQAYWFASVCIVGFYYQWGAV